VAGATDRPSRIPKEFSYSTFFTERALTYLKGRDGNGVLALGQPDIRTMLRQLEDVLCHPAEITLHIGLEGADRMEDVHQVAKHHE
ncbi:hypothetical protein AB9F35_34790, partial [Rhizobium leguminosarum]|uniref:hypothetical protein n=1 Tax=Rhizobium leguminosarum TaxID=384 RepID=UPI003F957308